MPLSGEPPPEPGSGAHTQDKSTPPPQSSPPAVLASGAEARGTEPASSVMDPGPTGAMHGDKRNDIAATDSLKLVGSLLWAARSTFVECSCGLVYLTSVMSCPTEPAWRAALHMCSYMYHNRHHGIGHASEP